MKNKILLISLLLIAFIASIARATTPTVISADSAYNNHNYDEAIAIYNKVKAAEGDSPQLLYNLGNAYAQKKDYGHAILNYERARKLDPSNNKIKNNLEYITSKVDDLNKADLRGKQRNITPDDESFFSQLYNIYAVNSSTNTWAMLSAILFILSLVAVAIYLFAVNIILRKIGFFGGITCILLSIICIVFAFSAAKEFNSHEEGVIIAYKQQLLTEPNANSSTSSTPLNAGTKIKIIMIEKKNDNIWYKVRLNSDFTGWIESNDVEVI
jgi:tetratricopeptide (TPR) repeat protein